MMYILILIILVKILEIPIRNWNKITKTFGLDGYFILEIPIRNWNKSTNSKKAQLKLDIRDTYKELKLNSLSLSTSIESSY